MRGDPKRLGRQTDRALRNVENELWLSPISTWEALTLHYKGRLQLGGDLTDWVEKAIEGMREAFVTHEIVTVARDLPMHQDPSDRMIAATAKVLDLTLVTADERLLGLGNIKTLANR